MSACCAADFSSIPARMQLRLMLHQNDSILLYGQDPQMAALVSATRHHLKGLGSEPAALVFAEMIPAWWVKLMPRKWQRSLEEELALVMRHTEEDKP